MKLKTIILIIGLLSSLVGCKNGNRNIDKHGNEFYHKDDVEYIIPAEYEQTGESYKVFLINETNTLVKIKDKFSLQPNEDKIFEILDTDSILFESGTKLYFGEYGLEKDDVKGELAGIGGDYWDNFNQGYLAKVKLINDDDDPNFFTVDMFMNKENMRISSLTKGMKISGLLCFQEEIS